LILAANSIYFIVLFHILFGTYIYKDFISNGAYIFTRLKSRKTWFYRKSFEIIKFSMIYSILFVGLCWLSAVTIRKNFRERTYCIRFFLWFSCSFLITLTTILINMASYIGFRHGVFNRIWNVGTVNISQYKF